MDNNKKRKMEEEKEVEEEEVKDVKWIYFIDIVDGTNGPRSHLCTYKVQDPSPELRAFFEDCANMSNKDAVFLIPNLFHDEAYEENGDFISAEFDSIKEYKAFRKEVVIKGEWSIYGDVERNKAPADGEHTRYLVFVDDPENNE